MTPAATPAARFVIACPSCQGQIAAPAAGAGRTGCCPLCATMLVVPAAAVSATPSVVTAVDAFANVVALPQPATPDPGLTFREPLRTVAVGDRTIEIRRLTDEDRRSRRARRNLILLFVGGALLIALTVAFGYRPPR